MNIDEILGLLKQVSEEVDKLKAKSEQSSIIIDQEKKLLRLAKEYPITSHILRSSEETIRYDYIAVLISLFNTNYDEYLRLQRMLLVYRIIASFDDKINMSEYVAKSMKVDIKYWDDFMSTLDFQTAFYFAVDVLLLGMYDVKSSKIRKYEEISDVFQFLRLDRKIIEKVAKIAKSIMEQDFGLLLKQIEPLDKIDYSCFLKYFEDVPFTGVVNDIGSAKQMEGNVLIVNAKVSHVEDIINLDEFMANDICFSDCTFEFIRGIKSCNKSVIFEGCSFEENIINTTEHRSMFGGSYTECEENNVFIEGSNLKFVRSKFINCKVSKSLLNISNAELVQCEFVGCLGNELPCSYLIDLKKGKVDNCKFVNCKIETNKKNRGNTFGGILLIENCNVHECVFNNCKSYGNSGYGSYATYAMQILCAVNSKISECSFEQCYCSTCDSSKRTVTNYIIELRNSKEENNVFTDCQSYHYRYSDIGSSHNVGSLG